MPVPPTSPATSAQPPAARSRAVMVGTALACLPVVAVAQVISHIRVDQYDAWLFAYYGRQITRGWVLYEQLWDNKPPGIYWLNALGSWLSGGSLAGIIALCAVAVVATCVVFYALTRYLYGVWTAAAATFLAAVYLYQQYFHVGYNRPSTFFALTELLAVLLYVRATARPGASWRSLAAVVFVAGLGLWLKQSVLAASVAIAGHQVLLTVTRWQPLRLGLRQMGALAGGWLTAIALAAVIILLTSDVGWAWHAIVSFNRGYFLPGVGSQWLPQWFGLREQIAVLPLPAILAMATLVHAVAVRLVPAQAGQPSVTDEGTRPPMLLAMLWVWMAAGIYLALVGPHQRLHYLGVALPPLCLLAAHGVHLFLATGRRAGGTYPPYYLFVGVLWCGYMMITPLRDQWHALHRNHFLRFEDPDPAPELVTAELVRKHTDPADALFVWPYAPEIYYRADRPPAIRYIATEKAHQLQQAGQPIMDEIIALLKESKPKALVISPDRVTSFEQPRRKDHLTYKGMAQWLHANYRLCQDDKRQDLWLRRY